MAQMTVDKLQQIKQRLSQRLAFKDRTYLLICGGTGCHATGSLALKDALIQEITKNNLLDKVEVVETGCNGFCAMGPIMVVQPGDIFYQDRKSVV